MKLKRLPFKAIARILEVFLACVVTYGMLACARPSSHISHTWNPETAARYLDYREVWWGNWIPASRDHDTYCISCHTNVPYVFARPALRHVLGEREQTPVEQKLLNDVRTRVRDWNKSEPYYGDASGPGKTAESRGTESVLNALILASFDAERGQISDDTRVALDEMWKQQKTDGDHRGAWAWLQFDNEPWESKDSAYYGACLAAMAVGTAPQDYAATPQIQGQLSRLREYLRRSENWQPTINHVFLLWASTKLPGLLDSQEQQAIINEVVRRQQADGGWRLASITWSWNTWTARSLLKMWVREDGTPISGKSDGLATGLITFVLQEAGVPRTNSHLQRGLSWLMSNQTSDGRWPASSLNKKRDPSSETGLFMSDAATAFSVLSLSEEAPRAIASSPVALQ
jgi:squalene-hopene/tetraprenyl-beta-curcumene cyclase